MSVRGVFLDAAIQAYIVDQTVREPGLLRELRDETAGMSGAGMQIGADQGLFMGLLARMIGARRYLEIGVFTGYSSLSMALAMPDDAQIVACDVSDEYTQIARRYWQRAGVASKIDLHLAPALETLAAFEAVGCEPFDIAFIDADKEHVDLYYERCLRLVRTGGLVLIDNVLWDGQVLDARIDDADTVALRAINRKAGRDERVDLSLLPIGDGLLIARKR
jgi:caffeoyl-CoA O-methyltransferase